MGTVMRSLGYNPSPADVRELINSSEGAGQYTARGGQITFDLFESLMRQKARDDDTESELKDAFRVLDREGNGWISVSQMTAVCKVCV